MSKFKALVHHIIRECRARPHQLGAVRLNKVLWFSDVTAYKMDGKSITGATYIKQENGPVPKAILPTLARLEKDGAITIIEPEHRCQARQYISRKEPAAGRLSHRDKQIAAAVLAALLDRTANAVGEMSHDDIWHAARMGEEIPLYATLAANGGGLAEDGLEWAVDSLHTQAEEAARVG